MQREQINDLCFYEESTLRFRQKEFDALKHHMTKDKENENFAFGFGKVEQTSNGTLVIVNEILIPDAKDLKTQNSCAVTPSRHFQDFAYFHAQQTGQSIIDIHNHPGKGKPVFSSTDELHGTKNAHAITTNFSESVTLVMLVGNVDFDEFDAVIWDRDCSTFRSLHRLEIVGRPSDIYSFNEPVLKNQKEDQETYDRQLLIPGWNQKNIAKHRVAVVGLGGNGANLVVSLVGMGAASEGGVVFIDHDEIETSNLPRIPYATPEDVGMAKVEAAAQYAKVKNPQINVEAVHAKTDSDAAQEALKAATVIFGCVDNDGTRLILNETAVRYSIPYIDLGCDIQRFDDRVVVGGQVRIILPGQNACLVCCGGFDPAAASADLMEEASKKRQASHGYVRNSEDTATPSIASLNGVTAQLAITQFLALANGEQFGTWDFVNFDQSTLQFLTAKSNQRLDCPCCGAGGYLGQGAPAKKQEDTEVVLTEISTQEIQNFTEAIDR